MTDSLLIIFVKNPVLGKVKTRLAASLGSQKALEIYQKLLEHTANITGLLPTEKAVFYSDFIDENDLWDPAIYQKQQQSPGDLGERMAAAFDWGFQSGYKKVCIIGSDCFELTPEIILNAFQELDTRDAVLGPARDGGYYLLGLKQLRKVLFERKSWGTDTVASDTLRNFRSLDWSYSLLRPLTDVDEEQDLGEF